MTFGVYLDALGFVRIFPALVGHRVQCGRPRSDPKWPIPKAHSSKVVAPPGNELFILVLPKT